MSVKRPIPSFCKLYSIYKERPEEFWDETDVDSYFYHNVFDISLSQHRIVRVSQGFYKKSFPFNLFQFCDMKTPQRYILHDEVIISKRELSFLVKCLRNTLPKPKIEIGSPKSKDNPFAHYYNDMIEHPDRRIRLSFRFGNNNSCIFSIKTFELHGNQFKSICQVCNIFFDEQTKSFFLKFDQGINNFEETKKTIQVVIGDVYCPTCPNEKCVLF